MMVSAGLPRPDPRVLPDLEPAAAALRSEFGLIPTAGAVVRLVAEPAVRAEAGLVGSAAADPARDIRFERDRTGSTLVRCRSERGDLVALVADLTDVENRLTRAGLSGSVWCEAVGFAGEDRHWLHVLTLVHLRRRATFYPFAPDGRQGRDRLLELKVRLALSKIVPTELDMAKWQPMSSGDGIGQEVNASSTMNRTEDETAWV